MAASVLSALLVFFYAGDALETQREQFFDTLTQWVPAPQSNELVVIDIDRKAVQQTADKTWSRTETAELLTRLSKAGAKAVAVDFIFSTACDPSESANAALTKGISSVPVILGFLIAEGGVEHPSPVPPVAVRKPVDIPDLWFIDGAEASCRFLQDASRAAAAAFLVGDEDARIRRVQAYTIIGNDAYPTLGLEAARLAAGGRTPILGGQPAWVKLETRLIELDEDGSMRFAASPITALDARTVSAGDVLSGEVPDTRFKDKTVFIGSSMPNLGGLRPTASMPLEPSVQIHADVANAVLTGFIPRRDAQLPMFEAALTLIGGLLVALVATRLRPVTSAILGLLAVSAMVGAAAAIYASSALLLDAVSIGAALVFVLIVTSTLQFARVRRAESAARSKFSQYLPQSVVARYIDNPDDDRVAGEERPVTALFTDIEGFSTLSQKLSPRDLVTLLDIYYSEVNGLVATYGGMVDKVVGDAVHAFFNAPEDLEDHVNKAIDCAEAIRALTEEMRRRTGFVERGFGRTRIGIETGIAVLGEVGAGGKLDYTAHGDAINLAARLQEANKFLGTAICIGPEAAAQSGRTLRSVGMHEIRGFGEMELFTTEA
ncbi:MAG TPA: CHASE2 domain-containing protein [Pararhizobium sp.]|uniref:CHASE2 domain-containing protein n=1 Tax=Pararhizobium sp. TaxID=1977563 RepID=UPI002B9976A9|nr:CHASE2 domain-containing protein [Pararhizobium sp.]HTO33315.1 CHASE2 domain-containing protein [Pararhizobium sp.]